MSDTGQAKSEPRGCTCHPDERPIPCPGKHGYIHCWQKAVFDENQQLIVALKNRDRHPLEEAFLAHAMRVRRALELCV